MKKRILSAVMVVIMGMSVSLTTFAQTPKTIYSAANAVSEKTQGEPKKESANEGIIKSLSKEKTVHESNTAENPAAETEQKTEKMTSRLSTYHENMSLSYASFDYPKNTVPEKVDNRAYDIILGDKDSDDVVLVRLRAFDHDTSLNEEIIDENGLMYGMYTGLLTVASLNKSAAEISKGLNSQQIRREVTSLFNQALLAEGEGKAVSYTQNKEMGAIQIIYADEESAENCTILHGKDYDYVLFGVAAGKNQATLNKLENLIASSLKEKSKL